MAELGQKAVLMLPTLVLDHRTEGVDYSAWEDCWPPYALSPGYSCLSFKTSPPPGSLP